MAHFYGELQGNKRETTRAGTENSGIFSHIRGWNVGVYTKMYRENDEDHFRVYKTGGSSRENNKTLIYDTMEKVKRKKLENLTDILNVLS